MCPLFPQLEICGPLPSSSSLYWYLIIHFFCHVESAEVHGNLYGSSIKAVRDVARQGKTCLLEIDVQVISFFTEKTLFCFQSKDLEI
jgi:hypothetical protein